MKFGALNKVIAGVLAVLCGSFLWAADGESSIGSFLERISTGFGFCWSIT